LNRHAYFSSSCCAKCRWRPDQVVDAELALLEHLNLCFNQDDLQSFISTVVEEDRQEFEMEPFLKSYFELSKLDPVKNKDVIARMHSLFSNDFVTMLSNFRNLMSKNVSRLLFLQWSVLLVHRFLCNPR
jgi:hypothetical protein